MGVLRLCKVAVCVFYSPNQLGNSVFYGMISFLAPHFKRHFYIKENLNLSEIIIKTFLAINVCRQSLLYHREPNLYMGHLDSFSKSTELLFVNIN